jgi:hypothetical protein
MGGVANVLDEDVRGSRRGHRRHERSGFLRAFLPNSGTTGFAHEQRSRRSASTSISLVVGLINALEWRAHAAHRGDNDIITFHKCIF